MGLAGGRIGAVHNTSGETLKRQLSLVKSSSRMKDRVRFLTGIDFREVGPGWAEKAGAQLEADAAAGAVGIGEIDKGLGLSARKSDGTRLKIDDPALDPVWDAAARLKSAARPRLPAPIFVRPSAASAG